MIYKSLVASIIKCLIQLSEQDDLTPDTRESLEVSIQCLESAYGVQVADAVENFDILQIFKESQCCTKKNFKTEITSETKLAAEILKNDGNALMKNEKYEEALAKYSKAIDLDNGNAVFYCNRAAVYSKLESHYEAIKDCRTALSIDPSYSKAYGRLGLAYSNLNKYEEAQESYKKALEIEPDNESLRINLSIAEEKLNEQRDISSTVTNTAASNISRMDLSSLLSNPALMNMARQMLSDPSMQNMMTSLMRGNIDQTGRMDALIEAGQQLAQQMQNTNPDLIESLRQQVARNPNESETSKNKKL